MLHPVSSLHFRSVIVWVVLTPLLGLMSHHSSKTLDRETDTTLVCCSLHLLTRASSSPSRLARRLLARVDGHIEHPLPFTELAKRYRMPCSDPHCEQNSRASSSSLYGSPSNSNSAREENHHRRLDITVGTFHTLGESVRTAGDAVDRGEAWAGRE